jgi:hypothetical protein
MELKDGTYRIKVQLKVGKKLKTKVVRVVMDECTFTPNVIVAFWSSKSPNNAAAASLTSRPPETPDRFTLYAVHKKSRRVPPENLVKSAPGRTFRSNAAGWNPSRRSHLKRSVSVTMQVLTRAPPWDNILALMVSVASSVGDTRGDSLEAAMLGCVEAHEAQFWFAQVGE